MESSLRRYFTQRSLSVTLGDARIRHFYAPPPFLKVNCFPER